MCLGVLPGTGGIYSDTRSLSGKERIYFYLKFQSGTESHGTSACFLSTPQCTAAASGAHTVKMGLEAPMDTVTVILYSAKEKPVF